MLLGENEMALNYFGGTEGEGFEEWIEGCPPQDEWIIVVADKGEIRRCEDAS